MVTIESPTRARLDGIDLVEAKKHLTYHDKKVDFEIQKFKHAAWYVQKHGAEAHKEALEELKKQRFKSLLFQDQDNGKDWTYSGLGAYIARKFNVPVVNEVVYPEPEVVPWHRSPDRTLRPYQTSIVEKLIEARHGGVEVGTGLGKSFCILNLAKHFGLKTVIMTPSVSIADQIHREFEHHFGKKYVGKYGDGKKDFKKLFTVAVAASLARLDEDSEAWDHLSKVQVFIADESHQCPAQTLAKVCFGLCANAPYRYFFSGTQIRGDGLGLLLDAITGDIVFRMTVKDGVDQGYLAKPLFRMVKTKSSSSFYSKDANAMTRAHLFYNDRVNQLAAEIANNMVEQMGRQVLILVEEMEQLSCLLPYLKHEVRFAHGGVTKENKDKVPSQFHDSDPNALVKEFNAGKFPILVGTSCVTTGTDFQNVECIISIQGGKSEVQVKQSVGRGTRLAGTKTDCFFIDFDVANCDVTTRHAEARREIYRDIYPSLEEMSL